MPGDSQDKGAQLGEELCMGVGVGRLRRVSPWLSQDGREGGVLQTEPRLSNKSSEVLTTKSDNPSPVPGCHMVQGENCLLESCLLACTSPLGMHMLFLLH